MVLPEPAPLLTETPKVPGLDGQKMSKSYGNAILMREDPAEVTKKIRTMQTDPARVRRSDKGDPNRCPVWPLHQIYSDTATRDWVVKGLHDGGNRLPRVQAARDRRDHPRAGADPRARAALPRRPAARAQHRRRRLRARAQARRRDDARRPRAMGLDYTYDRRRTSTMIRRLCPPRRRADREGPWRADARAAARPLHSAGGARGLPRHVRGSARPAALSDPQAEHQRARNPDGRAHAPVSRATSK